MVNELVSHYGFQILHAYLRINCFKTNPSIESSITFLKKTEWAREKVEIFYLYKYKSLPKVSSEQFSIPPRDRIVPDNHKPGKPAILSLEDAERMQEKQAQKTADRKQHSNRNKRSTNPYSDNPYRDQRESQRSSRTSNSKPIDPWANWEKKT